MNQILRSRPSIFTAVFLCLSGYCAAQATAPERPPAVPLVAYDPYFNRTFAARPRHDCMGTASIRGPTSHDTPLCPNMEVLSTRECPVLSTRSVRRASGFVQTGILETT